MFWALVIEPKKRYTQVVRQSFHVSMACMDLDTADDEFTSVMMEAGDDKLILCNLSKSEVNQQPLDLNFQAGDEISFYTKGNASIHLTGYLIIGDDYPGLMSDQDSEDEEEEDEEEDAKDRLKALASKAMKRGMEEKSSKNKKPKLDSSVTEEDSDEDDDDFELEESSDEETGEDEEDDVVAGESSSDDDSEEAMEVVDVKKSKKEAGNKKTNKEEGKAAAKKAMPPKKEEKGGDKKNESMNGTPTLSAKKKKQKDGATPKVKGESPKTPKTEELVKKTLPGGVAIEDLKIGNGPIAKAGRMVTVYYVGRLKNNNKQFDSTQQGPGFKFRLGSNEVIKGWDLGVSGMKVGGKRKIVCPPNMAYGSKGSPPVIPPNSSLVFEVELKSIN